MRATMKITNNNSLYYITRNLNNFMNVSNKISAERNVVDLEDDPMSATIGMNMMNLMSRSQQYVRNITTGKGMLDLSSSYMLKAKTDMDKVKTIATGAATESTTSEQRKANAIELNEIIKSLVNYGNSMYGDRYLFGGQQTTQPPFTVVNGRYIKYHGDDNDVNVLVDKNTNMASNATGSDVYGNMTTTIPSRDLNPGISMSTDKSTKLSDLNGGSGVPKGKIMVYYSSYPDGLEVDLSGCDSLEDVKDRIESETLLASQALDASKHSWLDSSNLDWHDLQDRYVKVTMNPEGNGISLQEYDLGEPLPEPTRYESMAGLSYSGNPGYAVGGQGVAEGLDDETTVHDKQDVIYRNGTGYYAPLRVDNFAGNKVADALGISGQAYAYNPSTPDAKLDGFLHGGDLNPRLSNNTLLADLEGYNDSTYNFSNGTKPGSISFKETSQDSNNVFTNYKLTGLSKGDNTGENGELYFKAVNNGTAAHPDILVEVYAVPLDRARPSDLVATGKYTQSGTNGGTVVLDEANSSGVGGSISVNLPPSVGTASVNVSVDFGENMQASVHVPAFIEEQNPDGSPKDIFNIASGWSIRGLDKPPAKGYDENHPFSTDLEGNVSVNYRYDEDTNKLLIELSRPAFAGYPATVIATGEIDMGEAYSHGNPPSTAPVSGRVAIKGVPGFEDISGSVYIEIPAGAAFTSNPAGVGVDNATSVTYPLDEPGPAGAVVLGGATELQGRQTMPALGADEYITLAGDTLFKAGQVFDKDVRLPDGGIVKAGTPLSRDMTFAKGTKISADYLEEGTVLAANQKITITNQFATGTVIPRGSYYESPANTGFPAGGMGMSVTTYDPATGQAGQTVSVSSTGYDLKATFATVEDFNRAVEEAGIYVAAKISSDGRGLEFTSALAGAWLTVSEDYDCYEQMGDKYEQLSGLDISGLVKGVNSDPNGNVYTEVVYYPPVNLTTDGKVILSNQDGEVVEIDPGYYVRVYSDSAEMQKPYADRDNSAMVAEGFIPAGEYNTNYDPSQPYDEVNNSPFLPTAHSGALGSRKSLLLEERNNSGVSGTVDVNYYGNRPQVELDLNGVPLSEETDALVPYDNDHITIYPGGLRVDGGTHVTLQGLDMVNIVPGQNCDYKGTFHGTITRNDSVAAGYNISLYKDSSKTTMTARNDPTEAPVNGRVTLYEVDRHGNVALDTAGDRIVAGYVTVAGSDLNDGQSDNFRLTTGGARNGGQEREDNVFATINDLMDAMNANDAELIHDLLGNIQADIDRILAAEADVGSRSQRMESLSDRHADDILAYNTTYTNRVGLDSTNMALAVINHQSASQAYQAALQVSGQIMQMSLLQYI